MADSGRFRWQMLLSFVMVVTVSVLPALETAQAHSTGNIGCTNCGWQQYTSLQQYIDTATDYSYCQISTTEFKVKQSC